jgi:predicted DCC family thiol-disulfide oxidoreductase YuxK
MLHPPFINSGEQVVLYDGVCKLCNAWVIFLLRHRLPRHVRFAAVQSEQGKTLLRFAGLSDENIRTIVFINGNDHWLRAQAIFRIMHFLPWPWRAMCVFRFMPDFISNYFYDRIALNRYRLFGRYDSHYVIKPDYKGRFLDL